MLDAIDNKVKQFANFIEKNEKIVFIIILAFAIFLNVYKLGSIPVEINVDEAGMTYDAESIANYGVDRFEKKFPVYFINFGGGQSALYTYLNALLIKIFGTNNMTIMRLPAAILGIAEVVIAYFLVKEFKSKKQALLFMFLVTISPWHIMKSRWALDCYLLSPMLLFSIFSLVKAVNAKKRKLLKYFISGVIFGLTLYTYVLSYIIIPIFLIATLIYLIKLRKIKLKEVAIFAIPLIIFAIPLILMILVQKGIINEIDWIITIPKMHFYREGELSISNILTNIPTLQYVFMNDYLNYNSIKGFGTLYYFGTVLMIVGIILAIVTAIKNRKKEKSNEINLDIIMLIAFLSNLVLGLLTELNANKLNGVFISATYFELVTLREMYKRVKIIFTILIATYFISFILFIKTYFADFVKTVKPFHDNGAVEVMKYLQKFEGKQIHGDNIKYIYNIRANPISPHEFNETKVFTGLSVTGYRNYDGTSIDVNNCDLDTIYVTTNISKAKEMIKRYGFEIEIYKNNFYILYN